MSDEETLDMVKVKIFTDSLLAKKFLSVLKYMSGKRKY